MEYIQRNFEPLALRFLEYNQREFNSDNVMEHPSLVIGKINELNERRNWNEDGNNIPNAYIGTTPPSYTCYWLLSSG